MTDPPPGPPGCATPCGDRVSQNASVPDWKVTGRLMLPLATVTFVSVTVIGADNGVWSGMRMSVACTVFPAVSHDAEARPWAGTVVGPVVPLLVPMTACAFGRRLIRAV